MCELVRTYNCTCNRFPCVIWHRRIYNHHEDQFIMLFRWLLSHRAGVGVVGVRNFRRTAGIRQSRVVVIKIQFLIFQFTASPRDIVVASRLAPLWPQKVGVVVGTAAVELTDEQIVNQNCSVLCAYQVSHITKLTVDGRWSCLNEWQEDKYVQIFFFVEDFFAAITILLFLRRTGPWLPGTNVRGRKLIAGPEMKISFDKIKQHFHLNLCEVKGAWKGVVRGQVTIIMFFNGQHQSLFELLLYLHNKHKILSVA